MSYNNIHTAHVDGWNVGYFYGRMDELRGADYRIKRVDEFYGQLEMTLVDDVFMLEVIGVDITTD
jgi:hypothetical protein